MTIVLDSADIFGLAFVAVVWIWVAVSASHDWGNGQ